MSRRLQCAAAFAAGSVAVLSGVDGGQAQAGSIVQQYVATILYQYNALPNGSVPSNPLPKTVVGGFGVDFTYSSTGYPHATVWSAAGTPSDLHPTNDYESVAYGTTGAQTVGLTYAGPTAFQAALWTGTSNTPVDLGPAAFLDSSANGVGGNQQVGDAENQNGPRNAYLWTGTAASGVDLAPAGYYASSAVATTGAAQVGNVTPVANGNTHAALWAGTAASFVDLNPSTFSVSTALGLSATQQVGYGKPATSGYNDALLWTGSAASLVDLNPTGFNSSGAYATNGTVQAGSALPNGSNQPHALAWTGTAASAVDLQTFLPAGFLNSTAYAVDSAGDVFGTAVLASPSYSTYDAVEWVPVTGVPEPACAAGLAVAAVLAGRRRRRA